ncbi:MAG TPA: glycosyltransferase [Candidatus Tumulicola sp.]
MTKPSLHRELSERLAEERVVLNALRSDYNHITRSRFHALRMLWFSLKQLLGISSDADVYAAWSAGIAPSMNAKSFGAGGGGATLGDGERALVEIWNRRMGARAATPEKPLVTVVIPVFNHRDVTVRCLRSIAESWFESLDVQFVVVDDGSFDGTADVIVALAGVDFVRGGQNEGFIRACNRGAALARGKYVCFLNNDTTVRGGWLEHLTNTAESDPTIGIVGSKLLYPDGRLQEAGNIVWRDATGWNVGHFANPEDPCYNFLRDVDYVSGAALLVRRRLFERLGGFSEHYLPAYYEDADLCFGARSLGYRVVYQPRSVVVHYESVTSGDERTGTKRFQETNRPKFRKKWANELDRRPENDPANVTNAWRRGTPGRTILIVDSYVPLYDHEAGSQRMLHIVKMLRRAGYRVIFLPDNYAPLQPYTGELQQMGVDVLHHIDGGKTLHESLDAVLPLVDTAWISRPDLYQKYGPIVRRHPSVRVIYDTVDLSHVRKRREAEILGEGDAAWRELLRVELESSRNADATVVVTADERKVLEDLGIRNVSVIPTIHEVATVGERRYEESSGLLFIGNYNHPPNVDAVRWLCDAVMPIAWKSLPELSVVLVGSNPSQAVFALKSERVRVTGYVRDASTYFRSSRIFVAPLRFGAGMKGKIGQALAYALPVVTTPVGAEGLGLRDGENALVVAADPEAFAAAIVSLYGDPDRWKRISGASPETLAPFTPEEVGPQLEALLDRLAALQPA